MRYIGINTWGLNRLFAADTDGTLAFLREQGFDVIEPCLYLSSQAGSAMKKLHLWLYLRWSRQQKTNLDERDFAAMMEKYAACGLAVQSIHLSFFDELRLEGLAEKILDVSKRYGVKTFVFSAMRPISDARFAGIVALGERLKEQGCELLYHNHAKELRDRAFIEKITQHFRLELDVGWLTVSDFPAAEFLEKYADRVAIWHCKDFTPEGEFCAYGKGIVDHAAIALYNAKRHLPLILDIDRSEDMRQAVRESMERLKTT